MPSTSDAFRTSVRHVTVAAGEAGTRLDRFVGLQLPGVPPALVQRLCRQGQVRVNGARARGERRLALGDAVRLPPVTLTPPQEPGGVPAGAVALLRQRVLHVDDALMVLDKPPGMAVHGGSGQPWGVVDVLRQIHPDRPPELCHRLDRDTSGCLLLAFDRAVLRQLATALATRQMEKTYLALVRGQPQPPRGVIRQALAKGRLQGGERMVHNDVAGREAVSRYEVAESLPGAALVRVALETGRTHQIRVHLADRGHPLAGDDKYGDRAFNRALRPLGLRRLFLHAAELSLIHPLSGAPLRVRADLPGDLTAVVARLRQNGVPGAGGDAHE
ncbi:MAG: RluA family pseudouridine synthase [Magnetococcus sp. WYHC-3]